MMAKDIGVMEPAKLDFVATIEVRERILNDIIS
jgi:hypothetical protein